MKKERRTGTLTRTNRPLETYLAGLGIDRGIIANTLPWGNQLEAEAQRWMQRGGFSERGRITKRDADRMLKSALARFGGGR